MASGKRKEVKALDADAMKKIGLSSNAKDPGGIEKIEEDGKGSRSAAAKKLLSETKD